MKESSAQQESRDSGFVNDSSVPLMYKICVLVPPAFLEPVKEAMFTAGAGRYGAYDRCCWQTPGTGQFRPLKGSRPFTGKLNEISTEETWKVEMICPWQYLKATIQALQQAHPHEMPAFDFYPVSLALPEQ